MSTLDLTAIISVILVAIGGVVIPITMQRRKQNADRSMSGVVSWEGITKALQVERDTLREQLDVIDERHSRKIRDMEQDFDNRLINAKKRIGELEEEIAVLRRALRTGEPS